MITGGLQFGIVNLGSGAFLPVGPGIPPDVGAGLVTGPGRSLLTLAFSGNLDAIDPLTGKTVVVGATGLGDCSMPSSPCGRNSANALGSLDGTVYATDFANNLYSVNPSTAKARLIGATGIPGLPFAPGPNPDGTTNVYDESLFSFGGKLYANFAAAVLDSEGVPTIVVQPAIYEINTKTGQARSIAATDLGLLSIVNVGDTVYAFSAATGEVVTLDPGNGQTHAVSDLDPAAGLIAGAAPAVVPPACKHGE